MYLIFTFREFKSIHKGKTAILHLRFGTEKNRRLGSKKARYNRAFRKRHLFCLHIMEQDRRFELPPSVWKTDVLTVNTNLAYKGGEPSSPRAIFNVVFLTRWFHHKLSACFYGGFYASHTRGTTWFSHLYMTKKTSDLPLNAKKHPPLS